MTNDTSQGNSQAFAIRAMVVCTAFALLLFSTLFISSPVFLEGKILPKWHGFVGGAALICLSTTLAVRRPTFIFDRITLTFCLFIAYILVRMCLDNPRAGNIDILSLISFIVLYFTFRLLSDQREVLSKFPYIIMILCTVQALYGILQYTGVFSSNAPLWITGSFDNSAGFAACLSAGLPFCFYRMDKCVNIIFIFIIFVAVVLCGSRTGIIAIILSAGLFLGYKYRNFLKKRILYIAIFIIMFALLFVGLLLLKRDSASGRAFIWRNSIEMIANKPVGGHGANSFMAEYMSYQADFFEKNPESKYVMLADNIIRSFNEYLLLSIQYGLVGLLLLFVVLATVVMSINKFSIYLLCILSVAVFACFSYPTSYPFVLVLLAYSMSMISADSTSRQIDVKINSYVFRISGIVIAGIISIFLLRDIRFEYDWGKLIQTGPSLKYQEVFTEYGKLYKRWNKNPLFLYNYGAMLNHASNYANSNIVMEVCAKYINEYDVQLLRGNNYHYTGAYSDAEFHYRLAHHMIPNRFRPLYYLMITYNETGDKKKVLEIAHKIVNKSIKVPSAIIDRIIDEAQTFIKTHEE